MYQLKTERSYKIVIRDLHPKINTKKLSDEVAKIGHQTRAINNITRYDTKQPLPLFLIELEPRTNNKEIYEIKKILNTIVTVEPPRYKKDIPQCMRCQQYGHTKNYCNRSPACVKCAKNHLTRHCPYTGKIEVRCYNCNGNHPASYKVCEIRKQLKLFPPLRNRSFNNYQPQQSITDNDTTLKTQYELNAINRNIDPKGNRSYAQVTQNIGQATLTNNQNQSNNIEDVTEIKEMLRQSIKSTEMLGKMVSELNTILRQQVQQTTVMLQLLTNLLSKK